MDPGQLQGQTSVALDSVREGLTLESRRVRKRRPPMALDSNVVTVVKQGRRETRRFLAILAVAVLSLQVGGSASLLRAHGAELDSCGGHNDREHGGYHVHNWMAYCH